MNWRNPNNDVVLRYDLAIGDMARLRDPASVFTAWGVDVPQAIRDMPNLVGIGLRDYSQVAPITMRKTTIPAVPLRRLAGSGSFAL